VSLTYLQLMDELTGLVQARSDGTLFIHSNCNHAITFTLESGRISALYFGPRKGLKAMPLVRNITGGSCRFEASGPTRAAQELPSTVEILEMLLSAKSASSPQPEQASSSNAAEWSQILQKLQLVLTDHLGPISSIIFEESLADLGAPCVTKDRFIRLVDSLALNIEPDQKTRFREQIKRLLLNNA